ncbi:TRAP transporter small permease [Pararhizobium mangrovi]|uniref:TRAP transporter small permease protein n=1 Tax=Pararhizobium mangrovi TaxID=2590452 RepID=A0A506UAT0_9HYPH|nr:TRAP transporter small permease subunit [Pararhizobium mangrovi]TPW30628.1 TRAP transporter small permease [Pararhizobium mangrovi]
MDALAGLLRVVARILEGVSCYFLLPALVALVTVDVVLRYAFNSPLSWALEASSYLLLLFFLFGLLESVRGGAHIRVDLLVSFLSRGVRRAVAIVSALALATVFAMIARKASVDIPFAYSLPQVTPELGIRLWAVKGIVVFVSVLLVLYALLAAVFILAGRRDTVEEQESVEWAE